MVLVYENSLVMIDVSLGFADAEVAIVIRSRLILAEEFEEYCQSTKVK
jgi:hypothetical protein